MLQSIQRKVRVSTYIFFREIPFGKKHTGELVQKMAIPSRKPLTEAM